MANKNLNYNQKYRDEKLENNSQEERTRARISYFRHINNIFFGGGGGGWRGDGLSRILGRSSIRPIILLMSLIDLKWDSLIFSKTFPKLFSWHLFFMAITVILVML